MMMSAMQSLRAIANRHPWFKSLLKALASPFLASTSSGYATLDSTEFHRSIRQLKNAWKAEDIPAKQRVGVNLELAAYRSGLPAKGFDVLVDMLRPLVQQREPEAPFLSLLEVGCSSGYYAEALAIKELVVAYSGCDYSGAFIDMARHYYPSLDFRVEDATALQYGDASFDVVVSGCCLLHIHDYETAISEAARVARGHIVFHRTPILHLAPTTYFTKMAYGVKTVEIHFNEHELITLFTKHRLRVIDIVTLNVAWRGGDAYATKSYLCEKIANAAEVMSIRVRPKPP